MLMSAILLAAAIQGEPAGDLPSALAAAHDRIAARQAAHQRSGEYGVTAYQPRKTYQPKKACQTEGLEFTAQPSVPATVKKLGDLPAANHTLTVLRTADGCPVSSTIRYNVDLPPRR